MLKQCKGICKPAQQRDVGVDARVKGQKTETLGEMCSS